ncbi:XRE family transcriptional regulator [Actinoalloteichus sp. AHMU CJ021]|nr:XRE family transcriptional regulator [Actinoalloteichus sp. AHMU CJ021]
MPRNNPTVSKRQLGAALRRLRQAANLTGDEVARRLEWSGPKISNIETARVTTHPNDVRLLLDLYGVRSEDERALLLELCRGSRMPGWWQRYGNKALQNWANQHIGLEDAATSIRYFGVDLVDGPLQISDYARSVISAGSPGHSGQDIDKSVQLRAERREHFLANGSPLWGVLDEAVIRRTVGGPAVMRQQIDFLVEACGLPHVTLQVLPFAAGAHAAMGTAFRIQTFDDGSSIVYVENLTSAQYLERASDIKKYSVAFDFLRAVALSPDESVTLMKKVAKGL